MARDDERVVVLGGAAGAWGDTSFAAPQLLDSGRCDYILFEALAEITDLLLSLDGRISDGPGALGLLQLSFDTAEAAQAAEVVLQGRSDLVEVVTVP